VINPGENYFEIESRDSKVLEILLEFITGGMAEDIQWVAIYKYAATSSSTATIHLSGTVWVKRVLERN